MLKRLTYKQADNLLALLTAIVGFVIYWQTLCPTVNFIDSGELATVCYTMGVAHPTGYPLFTILGYVFSHIPMGLRVIYQLNLFAAVTCSVGLFFYFKFLSFFLNEFFQLHKSQLKVQEQSSLLNFLPAFCGTLIVGFSETFWSQALSIEVYSLHIVFIAVLLFTFTKGVKSDRDVLERKNGRGDSRYWYLFAYVLGLSFTNHLSTIFLAPAFLIAYFVGSGFTKAAWKRIAIMALPFTLGFSVYLYLPVRAINQPLLNWGNPVNLENLIRHLSGKVYRVWFLESGEAVMKQFKMFITTLPEEFAYVGFVVAALGVWKLFKESRQGLMFTLLLFISCVIFASFYDIYDIETYFLLAYVTIGIWAAYGIKFLLELRTSSTIKQLTMAGCLFFVAITCGINYAKVGEGQNTIVEKYTKDLLSNVQPNGIVISFQWDYFVSACYYLQHIEGYRPDVVIIDKELLRRTWYYPQLQKHYPWLIEQSKMELEEFHKELYKFENELPYNPSNIEYRYTALIQSFVEKNWKTRAVYVTPEIEQQYITPYKKIPIGLALQLVPQADSMAHDMGMLEYNVAVPYRMDKYTNGLLSLYVQAYTNNGLYLQYLNKNEDASKMRAKANELQSSLTSEN